MNAIAANPVPAGKLDPRWLAVISRLLRTEGGFVNSPNDHGGATNYGLSMRFLAQQAKLTPALIAYMDINHDGQIDLPDIAGMTMQSAASVYYDYFWVRHASTLPPPLDAAVFDQTVNDGLKAAVILLQLAVNSLDRTAPLAIDGILGAGTHAAVNGLVVKGGAVALLDAYRAQAAARYKAIVRADPSQAGFLDGWLNRAAELGNV